MATLAETYLPLTAKLVSENGKGLSAVQTATGKYAIRDANARAAISGIIPVVDTLSTMVQGGVHYVGRTSTALSDGSTTTTIIIAGEDYPAKQGDMVSLSVANGQDREFILGKGANNKPTWYELGSTGSLKGLAFKDSASGSVTVTGNTGEAGALTVDFSKATYNGALGTLGATFTGDTPKNNLTGTFTGTPATLEGTVGTEDTNLTVSFSNAKVNVITSFSSDAIASVPALSASEGSLGSLTVSGATSQFTRLTAYSTGTLSAGTGFSGKSTTFTGSFTPEGEVTSGTGSFVTGASKGTLKSSGTVGWNSSVATGTVSKPDVTVSPSSGAFFNGASVVDEVLSFSSGNALTGASAALAAAPTFTGTGFSGTLSFTGGTPTGDLTVTSGTALTSAGFSGTSGAVTVSGTPLGDLLKTSITFLSSASAASGAVSVTASGSSEKKFLTGVAYNGTPTAATITPSKGDVAATGTQTLKYKKPTTVSISYTPSGSVTMQDYTPSGTITLSGVPGGTITGSQAVAAHTHSVTATGSVTVS